MLNIQILHDKCVEYYNWIEYQGLLISSFSGTFLSPMIML